MDRRLTGGADARHLRVMSRALHAFLLAIRDLSSPRVLAILAQSLLLTLLLFGQDLNIYAFVGVIMLVGLVKKNGIMMIDFAIEAQRTQGKSPAEAMYEACLVRFRPIMMTTMAALVGTLPIALGIGAGAESRQPLGLAVVGGLVVSQTLTLFITPVFYLYAEAASGRLRGERRAVSVRPSRKSMPMTGRSTID